MSRRLVPVTDGQIDISSTMLPAIELAKTHWAVERSEVLAQISQVKEAINASQQMRLRQLH
ncbi:hypothetical protein P0D88_33960 [Paraburkholderia sp. RL18-103-BIB-C]|jgi:hypothetical protein|uniref:hypothetical protein n=1 Tax=unclassified Paraburkholderia TaxID=2615204 RepID=UPI0038B7EC12